MTESNTIEKDKFSSWVESKGESLVDFKMCLTSNTPEKTEDCYRELNAAISESEAGNGTAITEL